MVTPSDWAVVWSPAPLVHMTVVYAVVPCSSESARSALIPLEPLAMVYGWRSVDPGVVPVNENVAEIGTVMSSRGYTQSQTDYP